MSKMNTVIKMTKTERVISLFLAVFIVLAAAEGLGTCIVYLLGSSFWMWYFIGNISILILCLVSFWGLRKGMSWRRKATLVCLSVMTMMEGYHIISGIYNKGADFILNLLPHLLLLISCLVFLILFIINIQKGNGALPCPQPHGANHI